MLRPSKRLGRAALKRYVRRVLEKHKPLVIAITGSYGKTTAKSCIKEVLKAKYSVEVSPQRLNNDFGLAQWILGLENDNVRRVSEVIKKREKIKHSLERKEFPEVLICETSGSVEPGSPDMRWNMLQYTAGMLRPKIGIMTSIGPHHLEYFKSLERVIEEKQKLLTSLPNSGYALMNYDDENVRKMVDKVVAHKIFYGTGSRADYQVTNVNVGPDGLKVTFIVDNQEYNVHAPDIVNAVHVYGILPAIICGRIQGIDMEKIIKVIEKMKPVEQRGSIHEGIKETTFINDAFNANVFSIEAALRSMSGLAKGRRKIAILGDIRELGDLTKPHHEKVGRLVAENADILIAIGEYASITAGSAVEAGMEREKIRTGKDFKEAISYLKEVLIRQDVVLIKGGHALKLWKVVSEFTDYKNLN